MQRSLNLIRRSFSKLRNEQHAENYGQNAYNSHTAEDRESYKNSSYNIHGKHNNNNKKYNNNRRGGNNYNNYNNNDNSHYNKEHNFTQNRSMGHIQNNRLYKLDFEDFKIAEVNSAKQAQVLISDSEKLAQKISIFRERPSETENFVQSQQDVYVPKFDLISNFDRTLTLDDKNSTLDMFKYSKNEQNEIQQNEIMSEEFHEQFEQFRENFDLFNKCDMLHESRKFKINHEFKQNIQKLISEQLINQSTFEKIVNQANITFRAQFQEFMHLVQENKIPMYIVSQGIKDVIENSLTPYMSQQQQQQNQKLNKNRNQQQQFQHQDIGLFTGKNIFANQLWWSQNTIKGFQNKINLNDRNLGYTFQQCVRQNIIYPSSQNALIFGATPLELYKYNEIYDNIISIGFRDQVSEYQLEEFQDIYDVVIQGQGSFEYPISLINELLQVSEQQQQTIKEEQQVVVEEEKVEQQQQEQYQQQQNNEQQQQKEQTPVNGQL